MSLTTAQLDADALAIIADYPQSFVWKTGTYVCVADDMTVSRRLGDAGVFGENALTLHVRTALFTTRPRAGELVTYLSKSFRIASVRTSPDNLVLTISCEEITA